jgi:hypothetical protein
MPVMAGSLVADGVLLLALLIHAELLARMRRVDRGNPPWWFGYARDASNLSAILMLWGGFLLLGFPAAVAFLAAGLTTVATYVFDWLIARALHLPHPRLLMLVPLFAWVAIVILVPSRLGWMFTRLVAAVQPTP